MKTYTLLIFIFVISLTGQGRTFPLFSCPGDNRGPAAGQSKMISASATDQEAVRCAMQDKAGNLWFGTTGEGVYRYDGASFTHFTEKDGLRNNYVSAVLEDKAGNLWFGTNTGVCRYDGKKFTNITISATDGSNFYPYNVKTTAGSHTAVWSIFQDKAGKIWFGTNDDGVYCYDGKSYTHFLHNDSVINKNGLRLNAINSILEDKAGNIWFVSWFEGVCRYDGRSIINFKPDGEVWFSGILEDKSGNIWVGRRFHGVCRYDGKTFTNILQKGIFDSCGVGPMVEDKAGNIWFCAEYGDMTKRNDFGGVWRYDPSAPPGSSKAFTNFTTKDGLSHNTVFSITIDRSGKLWIGTRGLGLCSYDGKTFTNFTEKAAR